MAAQKTKIMSENKKYTDFYKNRAVKCLKNYTALGNAELNIRDQLTAIDKYISSGLDAMASVLSPESAGDIIEPDFIKTRRVEREILHHRMMICIAKRRAIERSLNALAEDEKTVLDRFFLQPKRYNCAEDLMELLGFEKTQIYRIRDRALRNFAENMFGCEM